MLMQSRPLVALLLAMAPALLGAHDSTPPRQLSVSGTAEKLVAPDVAHLRLSVHGRDASAEGAMTQAAARSQRVIAALEKLVEAKQIRATDTQLRQVVKGTERSWRRDSGEPVEMLASRDIQVERLAIDRLPDAMRALSGQDLARIDRVSTDYADADALRDELLLLAIDDARARASRMAQRLGVRLGLPLSVDTQGSPQPQPKFRVQAMALESDAGAGYQAAGEQRIEARVQIVFELEAP